MVYEHIKQTARYAYTYCDTHDFRVMYFFFYSFLLCAFAMLSCILFLRVKLLREMIS